MEILTKKFPSIKNVDPKTLSELKVALLDSVFAENAKSCLSLQAICDDGIANGTGEVGKYWKSNYVLFCMKRLCENMSEV